MSQRGSCARRGIRVDPRQTITLAADARRRQDGLATVLLNKPAGYVSGSPEKGCRAAVTLITAGNRQNPAGPADPAPSRHGLAPAGRLDMDSLGLLVFTQDGRIARRLIGPQSRIEKEYLVRVEGGGVDADKLALLRHGLSLDGKPLRPAKVEFSEDSGNGGNETLLRFTLIEGRKRQIRRMCEQLDLRVSRLLRVRIGGVQLGDLESGKWRRLRPGECF